MLAAIVVVGGAWGVPGAAAAEAVDTGPLQNWMGRQGEVATLRGGFRQERRLRTIRRPLVSEGRFWFAAPDRFRWEVGDPPKLVAVNTGSGEIIVSEPGKGKIQRYDLENPKEAEAAQRLGLFQPGLFGSWEQFQATFRVSGLEVQGHLMKAELRMRDSRMALAVLRVELLIDTRHDAVRAFELFFRDGSSVAVTFLDVAKNAAVADEVFTLGN